MVLIENDAADIEGFKQMLNRTGYRTALKEFQTAEEALHYLEGLAGNPETLPDIIISDLGLPGEGGIEVLKKIRGMPHLSSTPVIIVSGSTEREDIINAYKFGATFFMTKSSDAKVWAEAIAHLRITGRLKNY